MNWSDEQEVIFSTFAASKNNLIIDASPGSGKTTVIRELWNRTVDSKILYLAFNKSIVQEAESKLPKKRGSRIQTFNGLGHTVVSNSFKVTLNTNKVYTFINEIEDTFPENKRNEYKYNLFKAIQYCKSNIDPMVYENNELAINAIQDIIEYYDLDSYINMEKDVLNTIKKNNRDTTQIDFA